MLLKVVTNVANFGAFVDVGVHQDGLVHVSRSPIASSPIATWRRVTS
jgi:transcriptional accessory protein Tex/SPT6